MSPKQFVQNELRRADEMEAKFNAIFERNRAFYANRERLAELASVDASAAVRMVGSVAA